MATTLGAGDADGRLLLWKLADSVFERRTNDQSRHRADRVLRLTTEWTHSC